MKMSEFPIGFDMILMGNATAMNYFAFSLIGQASTQFDEFVMRVLWPTLVYNIALFVILFVPVKKVFTDIS